MSSCSGNACDATQGTVFSSDYNETATLSSLQNSSTYSKPISSTAIKAHVAPIDWGNSVSPIENNQDGSRSKISNKTPANTSQSINKKQSEPRKQRTIQNYFTIFKKSLEHQQFLDLTKYWINEFNSQENHIKACDDLMTLFLQCSGLHSKNLKFPTKYNSISNAMNSYVMKLTDLLKKGSIKMEKEIFPPLTNTMKNISENLRSFVMHIVVISSNEQDHAELILNFFLAVIESFRSFPLVYVKHTCAVFALSTLGGALQTYNYLNSQVEKLLLLIEPEERRPHYDQNKSLLARMHLQVDTLSDSKKIYELHTAHLLSTVFSHFGRSKEGKIVAEWLFYLSTWMATYPSIFLTPTYLQGIMKVLTFSDACVRIQSLLCLQNIFTANPDKELVQHCYIAINETLYRLVKVHNLTVAKLAIDVIRIAYRNWENIVPRKHIEDIFNLVYCEKGTLAKSAGQLLWYFINKLATNDNEVLINIAEFHCEAEVVEKNLHQLVNAIFPWDTDGILNDWLRMTNILLDKDMQQNYNLDNAEVLVFTKIMTHLVRIAVTGTAQVTKSSPKLPQKEVRKLKDHTKKVTTVFVKQMPALFERFTTNLDILTELITIPQYYESENTVTVPKSVQINLEYFLDFLDTLVMNETTPSTTMIHCVNTMHILFENELFSHITKPKIEETLAAIQRTVYNVCMKTNEELQHISDDGKVLISEHYVLRLETSLVKLMYMFHYFDFPEQREVIWNCIIVNIIDSFTSKQVDWSLPRLQKIPKLVIQVGKLLLIRLHKGNMEDKSEAFQKYEIFSERLLQILKLSMPDYQNIVKYEACDAYLQLTAGFHYWTRVQDLSVLMNFLTDYVLVEPNIPCEEMNAEEKYHHKRKRDIVGKVCGAVTNSHCDSIKPLKSLIFSQQLKCEKLYMYDNIVGTYLKMYLKSVDILGQFLKDQFEYFDETSNLKEFEELTKAWSMFVPTRVTEEELKIFHTDGLKFVSLHKSTNRWYFLRGLRFFSSHLKENSSKNLTNELGKVIQEHNLTEEDRKSVELYKNSIIFLHKQKSRATKKTPRNQKVSVEHEVNLSIAVQDHPPVPDVDAIVEETTSKDDEDRAPEVLNLSGDKNSSKLAEEEQNESSVIDHEGQTRKRGRPYYKLNKQVEKKRINVSQGSSFSARSFARKSRGSSKLTLASIDENSEVDFNTISKLAESSDIENHSSKEPTVTSKRCNTRSARQKCADLDGLSSPNQECVNLGNNPSKVYNVPTRRSSSRSSEQECFDSDGHSSNQSKVMTRSSSQSSKQKCVDSSEHSSNESKGMKRKHSSCSSEQECFDSDGHSSNQSKVMTRSSSRSSEQKCVDSSELSNESKGMKRKHSSHSSEQECFDSDGHSSNQSKVMTRSSSRSSEQKYVDSSELPNESKVMTAKCGSRSSEQEYSDSDGRSSNQSKMMTRSSSRSSEQKCVDLSKHSNDCSNDSFVTTKSHNSVFSNEAQIEFSDHCSNESFMTTRSHGSLSSHQSTQSQP